MHTQLVMLQMWNIGFPTEFESQLVANIVQKQLILIESYHQQVAIKMSEIEIINATNAAKIVEVRGRNVFT